MKDKTSDEVDKQIELIIDWINEEGLEGYQIDQAYITAEGYVEAKKRIKSLITQKVNEAERRCRIDEVENLKKQAWVNFEDMGKAVVIVQSIENRLKTLQSTNNGKDE